MERQLLKTDIEARFFGAPAMQSEKFLEIAGGAAEGTLFTNVAFNPDSNRPSADRFVKAFEEKYGTSPDIFSAMAYDAAQLATSAVNEGNRSGNAIQGFLSTLDGFEGVTGELQFDTSGNVQMEVSVFLIENGNFKDWNPTKQY